MSGTENILANASVVGEELELVWVWVFVRSVLSLLVTRHVRVLVVSRGVGACADATISLSGTFEL